MCNFAALGYYRPFVDLAYPSNDPIGAMLLFSVAVAAKGKLSKPSPYVPLSLRILAVSIVRSVPCRPHGMCPRERPVDIFMLRQAFRAWPEAGPLSMYLASPGAWFPLLCKCIPASIRSTSRQNPSVVDIEWKQKLDLAEKYRSIRAIKGHRNALCVSSFALRNFGARCPPGGCMKFS